MKKLVGLLLSLSLFAPHASEGCELPEGSLLAGYVFDGIPNCTFLGQVDASVREAAAMAENPLPVWLSVGEEGSDAAFDTGVTLEVFQRFVLTTDFGQSFPHPTVDNLAVITHEYGHALFSDALARQFPEYRDYFAVAKEFSREKMEALKAGDFAAARDIQTRWTDHLRRPEVRGLFRKVAPHQELYADVVAAFTSGGPAAISTALYRPGLSEQAQNLVDARSFSPGSFTIHRYNETEEHAYFWKVRRYIGESLWPSTAAQKRARLRQITAALLADVETHEAGRTPTQGNDAVIRLLSGP